MLNVLVNVWALKNISFSNLTKLLLIVADSLSSKKKKMKCFCIDCFQAASLAPPYQEKIWFAQTAAGFALRV